MPIHNKQLLLYQTESFRLSRLPLAAASERKTQGTLSSQHHSFGGENSLSGLTVLVVDDDADGCDLIKQLLSHCQASVIKAASAVEGLQLLKIEKPDVLISDIAGYRVRSKTEWNDAWLIL